MLILLIILKILLYLLLFIIGLALLLLLLPINYSGQVIAAGGFKAEVAVGWAWKLLGINAEMEGEDLDISLRLFNKRIYRIKAGKAVHKEEEAEADKEPEEKKKGKKHGKEFGIKDITDKALLKEIFDYFKRVIDIVKPKYLHLYGTYGFDDPSITGIVCGWTSIIKSLIPHARLNMTPDFTREVIDMDIRVEGSMVVGGLAYQTIRIILKKPVRKILFRKKKS